MKDRSEYMKLYRQTHKKERKEWIEQNKQHIREWARGYTKTQQYKEYRKTNDRRWRLSKKGKEYHRTYLNAWRLNLNKSLLNVLGAKCSVCRCSTELEIDHINGGGNKDREKFGGYTTMISYYLQHQEEAVAKLQVLCKTHNLQKEWDRGECRNGRRRSFMH